MLTREAVLAAVKSGERKSDCLDSRDFLRLCAFFPAENVADFGFELKPGVEWEAHPWTEEEVKKQLAEDVAFGFEKALDQRGISASMMHNVVEMWMWVLESGAGRGLGYAQYGLPLFKAVALEFGFPNPIGDDLGSEDKYSEYGW